MGNFRYFYKFLVIIVFMYEDYFVVDIETCPIELEGYFELEDEEQIKKLNPIDSKIVAIGVRCDNENKILMGDEKEILTKFWEEFRKLKMENNVLVGFGINNFDIPFIVSRSFILGVEIVPFSLKSILDLREKINAYRYGKTRGRLKDYGRLLGLDVLDIDGGDVAGLCRDSNFEKLKEYLAKDLEITEVLFRRAKETGIINISRY